MDKTETVSQQTNVLAVGQPAPEFTLRCVEPGGEWDHLSPSQSLSAGRYAVLVFFPMAFSPGCTAQLPTYSKMHVEFDALRADIYGITRENPYVLREWTRKLNLQVPLLSDQILTVAEQYGVALPHAGVCRRATFVINPSGTIVFAFAEDDSNDLTLDADEVLEWLQKQAV